MPHRKDLSAVILSGVRLRKVSDVSDATKTLEHNAANAMRPRYISTHDTLMNEIKTPKQLKDVRTHAPTRSTQHTVIAVPAGACSMRRTHATFRVRRLARSLPRCYSIAGHRVHVAPLWHVCARGCVRVPVCVCAHVQATKRRVHVLGAQHVKRLAVPPTYITPHEALLGDIASQRLKLRAVPLAQSTPACLLRRLYTCTISRSIIDRLYTHTNTST